MYLQEPESLRTHKTIFDKSNLSGFNYELRDYYKVLSLYTIRALCRCMAAFKYELKRKKHSKEKEERIG